MAEHPCEAEIKSACPDRPGSEIARCLKDDSEHEMPTTISSECTDFIALNVACAESIKTYCEEAFFSQDTVLCLTSWIDQDSLPPKCAGVMKWAIPKKDSEAAEGPTDELGLSAKDHAEKEAWRLKRKTERTAAVERMKESDKQKEAKRREMEKLKRDNPEEYKQRLAQEELEFKNAEEQKRRDRMLAAALERKRREEEGLPPVDDLEEERKARARSRLKLKVGKQTWLEENWLALALSLLLLAYIFFNVMNFFKKDDKVDDKDE